MKPQLFFKLLDVVVDRFPPCGCHSLIKVTAGRGTKASTSSSTAVRTASQTVYGISFMFAWSGQVSSFLKPWNGLEPSF